MIYLIEIFKGILLSFGIIIGFISAILFLMAVSKMKSGKKQPKDLIESFQSYRKSILDLEKYEEIRIVDFIIQSLKNGITPLEMNKYNIKKTLSFKTTDKNGSPIITPITQYEVSLKE